MQKVYKKTLDSIIRDLFGSVYLAPDNKIVVSPVKHLEYMIRCFETINAKFREVAVTLVEHGIEGAPEEESKYIEWTNDVGKIIKSALFSQYHWSYNYSLTKLRNKLLEEVGKKMVRINRQKKFEILEGVQFEIVETGLLINQTYNKCWEHISHVPNDFAKLAFYFQKDAEYLLNHLISIRKWVSDAWSRAHDNMDKICVINEYKCWIKEFGKLINEALLTVTPNRYFNIIINGDEVLK